MYEAIATQTSEDISLTVTAHLPTQADAEFLASTFPKTLRMRAGRYTVQVEGGGWEDQGAVSLHLAFVSNGSTGTRNESAERRYRTLRRVLADRGDALTWKMAFANSITEAEFEASALAG